MNDERPIIKGNARLGYVWLSLGLVFLAVLIFSVSQPPPAPAVTAGFTPQPEPAPPKFSKRDAEVATAAVLALQIKAAARNPDSFVLEKVLAMPKGALCLTYRAQNGFGGMNRENAIAIGNQFKTTGSAGFAAIWNKNCVGIVGDLITEKVGSAIDLASQ